MFCRKCGKQILEDSRFCQFCGEAVVVPNGNVIEQTAVITQKAALDGTTVSVTIDGIADPIKIAVPPNTIDGQVFRLSKVKMTEVESGKKVKKDVFVKVTVQNSSDEKTEAKP